MNRRVFIALSGLAVLAGCGFQLRGTEDPLGQLPTSLRIEATDPYSSIVRKITRELTHHGVQIVSTTSAPALKLTLPKVAQRVLGPVSGGGDQTELALEMTYSLSDQIRISMVPETEVRVTLIYVDSNAATSAEHQSVAQLRGSLEDSLVQQVVTSLRVRYEQAVEQTKKSKTN